MSVTTVKKKFTITVERVDDSDGDTSWLGEYVRKGTPSLPYFDRATRELVRAYDDNKDDELVQWNSREYRYIDGFQCPEDDAACIQDAKRLESYGDTWSFVGVVVTASIDGHEFGRASLYGIESDSDETYFDDEIANLTDDAIAQAEVEFKDFCKTHCDCKE